MSVDRLLGCCLACWVVVASGADEVELLRFDPPIVRRGESVAIRGEGKFPKWPVQVVVNQDDVQVATTQSEGSFMVTTKPDSTPGPVWIRVYDENSASSLIPLFVATTSVNVETEPNQTLSTATPLSMPTTVAARLQKSGELDTFRIPVKAGRQLVASVIGHRWLRSPMDALMQLVDSNGNVLLQNDDARNIDPQIVYMPTADEELYLRVMAYPETPTGTISYAGGDSFAYLLEVTQDAYVDHVLPLIDSVMNPIEPVPFGWNLPPKLQLQRYSTSLLTSPRMAFEPALGWQFQSMQARELSHRSDDDSEPTEAAPPCILSGHILDDKIDAFKLTVVKDQRYRATAHARSWGLATDTLIRIVDPIDKKELARNDDVTRENYDSEVEFTASQTGTVELQVSDIGSQSSPRHGYSILVEPTKPNARLSLSADRWRVASGGSVDVPVTIKRQSGYDKVLSIAAIDLPTGVTTQAVRSEPQGDSSKSITLKLTAASSKSFQGTFRILGHEFDANGQPVGESIVATYELNPSVILGAPWLTVTSDANAVP